MITAIIPARGGSKGFPRKNLALLGGRPLIHWTVDAAKRSELVDRVIVSTDDFAIEGAARDAGAEIFDRSWETATDSASSESALLEVVQHPECQTDLVVFLQATSPLRQPDDIDNAISLLQTSGADSLFSCRELEGYTWQVHSKGVTANYSHRRCRQDRPKRVEENGSIYVMRPEILLRYKRRLGGIIAAYEMHPLDSFQVDTPDDLEMIESLLPIRAPWSLSSILME